MDFTRGASVALFAVVLTATWVARLDASLAISARWIALNAAFWTAIFEYLRRGGSAESGLRFVSGLAMAAALAHLGWALLHLGEVLRHPGSLLNPAVGHSALFAPLGILALTPSKRAARRLYLAPALGSLPLAFAVARFGCLASGCCQGTARGLPVDAIPLCEIAGLLGLAELTRRLPGALVGAATLTGFGALRLALDPWRAEPALGDPLISSAALGIGWIAIGSVLGAVGLRNPRALAGRA